MTDIIIDCDPGQDDAIAIIMALASKSLHVLGITTVAGNVNGVQTCINAKKICAYVNRCDIPVLQGSLQPLLKDLLDASHIHGETGLSKEIDGVYSNEHDIHAVDFIIETIRKSPNKITIAATAALTNIALAFRKAPDIKNNIERIVLMGGSTTDGNITRYAEFNFFTDPHAASEVFESGVPIVMIGLNTTNQTMFDERLVRKIESIGKRVSGGVCKILEDLLQTYRKVYKAHGAVVHDGCVVAYLNDSSIFKTQPAHVSIETSDREKLGQSYVSFDNPFNALVAVRVDEKQLFDMMEKLVGNFD